MIVFVVAVINGAAWDKQIERDAACGKRVGLAAEARAAYQSGVAQELSNIRRQTALGTPTVQKQEKIVKRVTLEQANADTVNRLLTQSWMRKAPKRLAATLTQAQQPSPTSVYTRKKRRSPFGGMF